ncbi:MAG TPA: TetR/AcrR family transcriptional regulator [Chloroflexia bacterium]|nr:TetR/AcrR family transcriptional regulator [Chloroflexia bacterium]
MLTEAEAEELTPRSKAKRQRIHLAALSIFMQHGFEATSMDAIASHANVSKPTLYRYYHNKETLFIATLRELMLEQAASAETFSHLQQIPVESLEILEHSLVRWAQIILENALQPAYLGLVRVLICEIPRFPALAPLYSSAIAQEGGAIMKTFLESAISHGVVTKKIDLDVAVRLLVGSLLSYVFSGLFRPAGDTYSPPHAQIEALVHLFLQGITGSVSHLQQPGNIQPTTS